MKIIAINKTLNEENFIADFCIGHSFCDLILVADGGSADKTISIARNFGNVKVRQFRRRKWLTDGSFMNPEPQHVNFLLDWADNENADWILFTGCDTWPNLALHRQARRFFEQANSGGYDGILATQLYMWGNDQYFPKVNEAGASLWAWKASLGLRCDERGDSFFNTVFPGPARDRCLVIEPPAALMHYYAGPDITPQKLARYEAWGHPQTHPLQNEYAPPVPLPDWARENQI